MSSYVVAIRVANGVGIALGVLSIICGAVGLHYAGSDNDWPASSGAGIWCGAIIIVLGILALVATHWNNPTWSDKTFAGLLTSFAVFNGISQGACSCCIAFSIQVAGACTGSPDKWKSYCEPNLVGVSFFAGANTLLAGAMNIIVIANWFLYGRWNKELRCNNQLT